MVLKIVKREVVCDSNKSNPKEIRVDRFFDGFDKLVKEYVNEKDTPIEPTADNYCFTASIGCPQYETKLKLTLIGNDVRVVVIDPTFETYLMSDAGKTIEKLN